MYRRDMVVAVSEMDDRQTSMTQPIGRDHEQRVLTSAFESARSGHGRLILIGGEAGIGKTTLVEHFVAGTSGATVLTGTCYDVTSVLPYAPWRDALSSVRGEDHAMPSSLHWLDAEHLPSLSDQTELFGNVQRCLVDVASRNPCIIVFEDIHWSDRESLELLRYVGRSVRSIPILIVATYRNDEITSGHPLYHTLPDLVREARAERIDLRRFASSVIREIVDRRYQLDERDAERLVDELERRTEGNPLFIVELLRSIEQAGLLFVEGDGWRLAPLTDIEIPLLVRQVIGRRLRQLDTSARVALQSAAILGYEVRPDLWLSLIEEDEAGLSRIVQQALDAYLLEQSPRGAQLRFRHALVQEALYASVPLPWRQLQHRRIAETLAEMPGADPATIVEHFRRAGDPRVADWSLRAARQARRLPAPYAIIQNLSATIATPDALSSEDLMEALRLRGWAYEITAEFDAANSDYLAVLRIALDANDRYAEWDALIRIAELWAGRDYRRAGEYIERALAVAGEIGDQSLIAYSLNRMGNWYLNREEPDRATEYHRQALDVFQRIEDRRGIAVTEDLLGMACMLGGNPVDGARHYERAIDLFTSLDDRQGLVSSLANYSMRGVTYQTDTMVAPRTTLDECIGDAERALNVASGIDFRAGEIYAQVRLAACLGARGEYQRSLDAIERSLSGAEEIGHRQWAAAASCVAGTVYLDLLEPSSARQILERGREAAERSGTIHWIRSNSGILATAYVAAGEIDEAVAELRTTWTDTIPARTMAQRQIWRARIELELARGNVEHAIDVIDRVLDSTAYASRERPAIRLSLLRALALIEMKRYEEARQWLRPARAVAREQGARPLLWRLHRALGLVHSGMGHRMNASREFAEARRLIEEIGSTLAVHEMRSRFLTSAHGQIPEPWTPTPLQSAKQSFGGLTRRQREVAVLIALGCSNREIADDLSISERTVESHVTAILSTLSLRSRAQIAAWSVENGLVGSTQE
jgi:DNA-binding CsgD family transcriptional regulator/tetratricopeptide (TPR) repeat protein